MADAAAKIDASLPAECSHCREKVRAFCSFKRHPSIRTDMACEDQQDTLEAPTDEGVCLGSVFTCVAVVDYMVFHDWVLCAPVYCRANICGNRCVRVRVRLRLRLHV